MERAITVDELKQWCLQVSAKGLGSRKIMISQDDEGNGFHALYFAFSMPKQCISKGVSLPYGVDEETAEKEWIVLG